MRRAGRTPEFGKEQLPHHARAGEQIGQTPFRRCKCGRPLDTRKTAWSKAEGGGLGAPTDVVVDGETQDNTKDRDEVSGCWFCGRTYWLNSKPNALPDDRNKPSDEWRNRRKRR